MTETDNWLAEFEARHESAASPTVYRLSLLLLLIGTVGLLWALPVPNEFASISPLINWGSVFLMAALVYYFVISLSLGIGMVPFMLGIGVLQIWLSHRPVPLAYSSSVLIGAAIAGLCFGHYASGGWRAVLKDVQLVMIAPIWVLSNIYRKLGIPY